MPGAFDRKGPKHFLSDRFRRFGVPLILFFLVIIPIMHYVYFINYRPYGRIPFFAYYTNYYLGYSIKPTDWSGPSWPEANFGHLWFIEHLLIAACCYTLWRFIRKSSPGQNVSSSMPGTLKIITFSLMIALITIIVRIWYPIDRWIGFLGFIQVAFADVPRDIGWFIVGVLAYRNNWLVRFQAKAGYIWLTTGIILAVLYYLLAPLKLFPYSIYPFWEMFLCTGLCIGIPVIFREKLNRQGIISRELAACTYGVYLGHVPILVSMQYAFASINLGPNIKFVSITLLATIATFTLITVLRRLPFVRTIL